MSLSPNDAVEDDELLTRLIALATQLIVNEVGFPLVAETETTRKFDLDCIRGRAIYFDCPLVELTEVTNGDGTVIPLSEIVLYPANDVPYWGLQLARGSSYYWLGRATGRTEQVIELKGWWGWSKTVPVDIQFETDRLALFLLRQRDHSTELGSLIRTYDGNILMPTRLPSDVLERLQKYAGYTS